MEGGTFIIRRSAIGLNASRDVLFVAVSNDTTATAIAKAMHHAGAADVAQLDVNWSYPKFLLFPVDATGQRHAEGLFEGFVFRDDEYVQRPANSRLFLPSPPRPSPTPIAVRRRTAGGPSYVLQRVAAQADPLCRGQPSQRRVHEGPHQHLRRCRPAHGPDGGDGAWSSRARDDRISSSWTSTFPE